MLLILPRADFTFNCDDGHRLVVGIECVGRVRDVSGGVEIRRDGRRTSVALVVVVERAVALGGGM